MSESVVEPTVPIPQSKAEINALPVESVIPIFNHPSAFAIQEEESEVVEVSSGIVPQFALPSFPAFSIDPEQNFLDNTNTEGKPDSSLNESNSLGPPSVPATSEFKLDLEANSSEKNQDIAIIEQDGGNIDSSSEVNMELNTPTNEKNEKRPLDLSDTTLGEKRQKTKPETESERGKKFSLPSRPQNQKNDYLAAMADNPDPHAFHPTNTVYFAAPPALISVLPPQARLFLGNLASERTDKHEIASIFAKYGNIVEISLKSSFGFVQFETPENCQAAIAQEQGRNVGGMNLDLKVSRDRNQSFASDHGNSRSNNNRDRQKQNTRRDTRGNRDYSPDYSRKRDGGSGDHWSGPTRRNQIDRYKPGDDKASSKPYDRFDDRRGGGRGRGRQDRDRSPTRGGRRDRDEQDSQSEFPLPRRYGTQVPQCQVIIRGEVDRRFISQVESSITAVGFTVDKMFLSPKLVLSSVINQMIAEGVRSLIFLERMHERDRSVSLQIFQTNGKVQAFERISIEEAVNAMIIDSNVRMAEQQKQRTVFNNAVPSAPAQDASSALSAILGGQTANVDASTLLNLLTVVQQQQQQQIQQQPRPQMNSQLNTGNLLAALGRNQAALKNTPGLLGSINMTGNLASQPVGLGIPGQSFSNIQQPQVQPQQIMLNQQQSPFPNNSLNRLMQTLSTSNAVQPPLSTPTSLPYFPNQSSIPFAPPTTLSQFASLQSNTPAVGVPQTSTENLEGLLNRINSNFGQQKQQIPSSTAVSTPAVNANFAGVDFNVLSKSLGALGGTGLVNPMVNQYQQQQLQNIAGMGAATIARPPLNPTQLFSSIHAAQQQASLDSGATSQTPGIFGLGGNYGSAQQPNQQQQQQQQQLLGLLQGMSGYNLGGTNQAGNQGRK